MGYFNPLLKTDAAKAMLDLPEQDLLRIEGLMRDLRAQANANAEKAWASRKGVIAAYWRAVSTYARHVAHICSKARQAKRCQRIAG